jgi:hypothetical protein
MSEPSPANIALIGTLWIIAIAGPVILIWSFVRYARRKIRGMATRINADPVPDDRSSIKNADRAKGKMK